MLVKDRFRQITRPWSQWGRLRALATTPSKPLLLHEVTPRDGLQNEKVRLSVDQKVDLIHRLIELKPSSIEVASFVRGDLVPNMAGSSELCKRLADSHRFREYKANGGGVSALVPNMKGFEELMKHKSVLDTAVVLVSATDSHSKANVNRTMKDALKATLQIIDTAKSEGLKVRAYVSLAFGCPFEGEVPPGRVIDVLGEYAQHRADMLMLADTLGVGKPEQVRDFAERIKAQLQIEAKDIGLHLHDSHNKAHENVIEAWKLGIRSFDAAVGGCGGCNFAPGSKGNISIEKLVRAIESTNSPSNIDKRKLVAVNRVLGTMLSRELEQQA